MPVPSRISSAAKDRIRAASGAIQHSVEQIQSGTPLEAEPVQSRKVERVAAYADVNFDQATRIAGGQDPKTLGLSRESLGRAEAIQGKTVDYLGVAWLDAGRLASKAVARILFPGGGTNGTAFLVSDRLLLTNNHVIPDANAARGMIVEFRFELPLNQRAPSPIRFALDPGAFFETNDRDNLDYTLIALGPQLTPGAALADFGSCPLSASGAKHSVGESVNIVEHPDGDYKQIVVRDSRIVHRGDTVLHYLADTEPGSSGSPVFNDQWQVVALHHWGGPHRELSAAGQPLSRDVNEGIRISAIIADLQSRARNANQQALLARALDAPPPTDFGTRTVSLAGAPGPQTILAPQPILPAFVEEATGVPASRIDRTYSNRRGYNPRFLSDFPIPLPQLNALQRSQAARVGGVGTVANPFELKYEHFSVVLNARRRMAFFSACNIDGAKRILVNRDSGLATSQPEATEVWATDPRVPDNAQLSDAFYNRLRALRRDNRSDFFARGHLTRREDPNWGTALPAQRANNDTYHHPNACPQVNIAFNASQKVWQGIENFVLNSADDSNLRVTVITGPVFADNDPVFEDDAFGPIQLPRRFWKIVARVEDGERKVFAVLADQSEAMDQLLRAAFLPEAIPFQWPTRLNREFRSTVETIASLTGLDFGDLANHDVFADGSESLAITSPEALLERPAGPGAFGKFESIADFLEAWENTQREAPAPEEEVEDEGAERRRKPKPRPAPRAPQARQRKVVEIVAQVARIFEDDLSGAKHQQFTVIPKTIDAADARTQADVQAAITQAREVRLAVRFGDSMGLADRIPGIRTGVQLHLKGEWIPASEAFAVGGEKLSVLHFTHDPLGFVCTPIRCFS